MDLAYTGLTSPAILPLGASALVLRRVIEGPDAIFSQVRMGHQGQLFTVHKIRTMANIDPDTPSEGARDIRATELGKKFRVMGIDEFPQILNILEGDMSVVGPRALYPSAINAMREALPRNQYDEWEEAYFSSKPGMVSSFVFLDRLTKFSNEQERYAAKAAWNIADFKNASLIYDHQLIIKAAKMTLQIASKSMREPAAT
jgi:lipopolysaccharide/colanic/teichoic acid biosynthesis glycosyltransferase